MSFQFCISEQDAKQKTCPISIGAQATETMHGGPWGCIGSECMAWRWIETHINDDAGGTKPSGDTHGYCGLAGEPWSRP